MRESHGRSTKLTTAFWHCLQDAESWCRQPAKSREPQGKLWGGQEAAVTPPALQHMPQQPRAVVAVGVPVQEPAVGLPNNVFYTGHAVDKRPK